MDASTPLPQGAHSFVPKLRKNKRLENRWGLKYFAAVKDAVFSLKTPYMPSEPPSTINDKNNHNQPFYVCKQCKDCFRFLSSLEDHYARRSWILGYWCQNCFVIDCPHVPPGDTACAPCQELERQKKCNLRAKGLKKGRKMGCIKIFYNQCQFFAHLKIHQTAVVDMGDIMLMPMPTDIDNNSYPEVNKVCEILMEHMFLMRTHIMDWLKTKKVGSNWWKLLLSDYNSDDNPMIEIIKGERKRLQKGLTSESTARKTDTASASSASVPNSSSSDVEIIEDAETSNGTEDKVTKGDGFVQLRDVTSIDPSEPLEDDDNPFTVNDIAFVDCGSPAKMYPPEALVNAEDIIPVKNSTTDDAKKASPKASCAKNANVESTNQLICSTTSCPTSSINNSNKAQHQQQQPKISVKKFASENSALNRATIAGPSSWKSFSREYAEKKYQSLKKIANKNIVKLSTMKMPHGLRRHLQQCNARKQILPIDTKLRSGNDQLSSTKSKQTILTVHGPKNVDLKTIIGKLPSDVIAGKRIVLIGQDSTDHVAGIQQKEVTAPQRTIQIRRESSQGKVVKTLPLKVATANTSTNNKQGVKYITGQALTKILADSATSKTQPLSLDGKVIYQNGRKFIIRQAPKSISSTRSTTKNTKTTSTLPLLRPPTMVKQRPIAPKPDLLPNNIMVCPLTPSPSSSEASSGETFIKLSVSEKGFRPPIAPRPPSNSEVTSAANQQKNCPTKEEETLWIQLDELGRAYLKSTRRKLLKKTMASPAWYQLVLKYRQHMFDDLLHLSKAEIENRIEHLKQVNREHSKVMCVAQDRVIVRNMEIVARLEEVLTTPALWENDERESDALLREELSSFSEEEEDVKPCTTCDRPTMPKSFIEGMSRIPENGTVYCTCYNFVCHLCNVYQGNIVRFAAHVSLHKKQEPFICPECYKAFKSAVRLEAHVWTTCFHPLIRRWVGCRICQVEGFTDMESAARHFVIMHSEIKLACSGCHCILRSRDAFEQHLVKEHTEVSDCPVKASPLIVCSVGDCVTKPEKFRAHMDEHVGIFRTSCYKCPFCTFAIKWTDLSRHRFKNHLFGKHTARLREIISVECLPEVLASNLKEKEKSEESNIVVPKIMNTCTIGREAFDHVTEEGDGQSNGDLKKEAESLSWSFGSEESSLPKKLDVKSKTVAEGTIKSNSMPMIMKVRSIANNSETASSTEKSWEETSGTLHLSSDESELVTEDFPESKENGLGKSDVAIVASTSEDCNKPALEKVESTQEEKNESELNEPSKNLVKQPIQLVEVETESDDEKCDEKEHEENKIIEELPPIHTISKPPPLARIPQHILENVNAPTRDGNSEVKLIEEAEKQSPVARQNVARRRRRRSGRLKRIALNGPTARTDSPVDYRCHLCGEHMNTSWSVTRNHFETFHADYKVFILAPNLERLSASSIEDGDRDRAFYGRKRRPVEPNVSPTAPKRRRRWTTKKYRERTHLLGLGLCVKQESVQDGEGNFRCKKCDLRCSDMLQLRAHIAENHRIKDRYLVCLECGENFVVAPSLQMHLKAFHGIEDPITYLSQNTAYAPDVTDEEDGEAKTAIANQCHVCMAVFENKAAVDKHLRVHGMAFLNRKRLEARNALKSPEKKAKVVQDVEGKQISKDDRQKNDEKAQKGVTVKKAEEKAGEI